jgi:hypothetical protein
MKLFECQNCGQPLYFENTRCESCGLTLGYLPAREIVTARCGRMPGCGRHSRRRTDVIVIVPIAMHAACNWLISADAAGGVEIARTTLRPVTTLTTRKISL